MQVRQRTGEILEKFIIMDDVALSDETAAYGTVAIEGPQALAVAQELASIDLSALPARGCYCASCTRRCPRERGVGGGED